MYSARSKTGAVIVAPTHRITSIAGETVEYYLTDTIPLPVADIEPDLLYAEKVVIEPLAYSGGVVTVGTPATFMAQVEFHKARAHSSKRSPDRPEAKGNLVVKAANQKQVSKLLQLDFADSLEGKAFAACYAFASVRETAAAADDDGGDPGLVSAVPTPIPFAVLSLEDQYDSSRGTDFKIGDACVTIDRELITQAKLEAAHYFTLTPQGGQPGRYTLWNSDGIRPLNTFHWAIYLQRQK